MEEEEGGSEDVRTMRWEPSGKKWCTVHGTEPDIVAMLRAEGSDSVTQTIAQKILTSAVVGGVKTQKWNRMSTYGRVLRA